MTVTTLPWQGAQPARDEAPERSDRAQPERRAQRPLEAGDADARAARRRELLTRVLRG